MKRLPPNRYFVFLAVVGLGVVTDLYSKHRVFSDLGYPDRLSPWTYTFLNEWVQFRLYTSFNEGALWGFGQGWAWLFAIMSAGAALAIVYWLFVRGAAINRWLNVSLALVTAGALGNLWDRLGLHGCVDERGEVKYAVRDFLLFTFGDFHWPVFNFADVFLVVGAAMLVLQSFTVESFPETGSPTTDTNSASSS